MVVLVIWMSLRFGCRDPQLMVDCIRCAMRNKRVSTMAHYPNEFAPLISKWTTVLQDFLLRLRARQDVLANTEMDLEGFKRWMKLYHTPGSKSCGYMMYDDAGTYRGPGLYITKLDHRRSAFYIGKCIRFRGLLKYSDQGTPPPCSYVQPCRRLCPELCDNGLPWCPGHASNFAEGNTNPPRNTNQPLMHLPVGVRHLNVLVAGYFEPRWRTSRWECSLDTMRRQIR